LLWKNRLKRDDHRLEGAAGATPLSMHKFIMAEGGHPAGSGMPGPVEAGCVIFFHNYLPIKQGETPQKFL
jgi:hypothetical protein